MPKPEAEPENGLRLEYRGGDPVLVLPPRTQQSNTWVFLAVLIWVFLAALMMSEPDWPRSQLWCILLAIFSVAVLVIACCTFGHTRLRVTTRALVREHVLGPLRLRRRFPVASISAIALEEGSANVRGVNMANLVAVYSDGRSRTLVWSYPLALIRQLGHELSAILHIPFKTTPGVAESVPLETLPLPEAFRVIRENDRVRVEIQAESTAPRMLVFGLAGILGAVTQFLARDGDKHGRSQTGTWLVFGSLVVLVLALGWYLVTKAVGRVGIVVTPRGLELEVVRPFRRRRHSWSVPEISGMDIRRASLGGLLDLNAYELIILLRDRPPVSVLAWPNHGELLLLAHALQSELGLQQYKQD